jgi:hypothetical protein
MRGVVLTFKGWPPVGKALAETNHKSLLIGSIRFFWLCQKPCWCYNARVNIIKNILVVMSVTPDQI